MMPVITIKFYLNQNSYHLKLMSKTQDLDLLLINFLSTVRYSFIKILSLLFSSWYFFLLRYLRIFAGTPPTIDIGSTLLVTTAPAAIIAPSPIVTPGKIMQ